MHEIAKFSFPRIDGPDVKAVLSVMDPFDGRILRRGTTSIEGKAVSGWLSDVCAVPPADTPLYAALRACGASHYARLGDAVLALDEGVADAIDEKLAQACERARELNGERYAARREAIRATGAVRRVLRHSPSWPDAWGLIEAYPANSPKYAASIWFGLPGAKDRRVHPGCPSLEAVCQRSEQVGAFPSHANTLLAVSESDWDLLVAETAAMDAHDQRRHAAQDDAAEARRIALHSVDVPPDVLAAFRRFGGDQEAAWEAGDACASALIRLYGEAIEAQGLASEAAND
jgi:hypothetical protein